jgi:hypothetical protein
LVDFNLISAQGCKGAPPFGNSMGLNFSTSQTPEMSGTDPGWAAPWPRGAGESASIATTAAAEKIKRFRTGDPSSVLASSGEIGNQNITLDLVLEWVFRTPKDGK